MWFNMQHFSGLLRPLRFALTPRNDDTRQRHCELVKQSRQTTMPDCFGLRPLLHYVFIVICLLFFLCIFER